MSSKQKEFWNNTEPVFAHLQLDGYLVSYEHLCDKWKRCWLHIFSDDQLKSLSVIDYGCGGAWLSKIGFKTYTGVDISERSLNMAKQLHDAPNHEFMMIEDYYASRFIPCDLFVCQAVIQHFIDYDEYKRFFKKIIEIRPSYIVLEYPYNDKTVFIPNNQYDSVSDVVRACRTNHNDILHHLNENSPLYKILHIAHKENDLHYVIIQLTDVGAIK